MAIIFFHSSEMEFPYGAKLQLALTSWTYVMSYIILSVG